MHIPAILQILVLLALANGAPLVAKKILGDRYNGPLDFGVMFVDGRPLLGKSKTIRGIVAALVAATMSAPLIGLDLATGAIVAAAAMAGDLFSSFVKRRLDFKPSGQALGLDQVPESLLPMLATRAALSLTALDIAAGVALFFVSEILLSRLLFKAHLATSRIRDVREWVASPFETPRFAMPFEQAPFYPRLNRCSVISGGQLRRTGTTLDPAPTEV